MDERHRNKGLLGKLREAMEQAVNPAPPEATRPPRRPGPSGGLPGDGFNPSATARAPATGELGASRETEHVARQEPSDAQLSPRRLAMARDYASGLRRIPQMEDPAFMYKVVSDERAYQTRLLFERRKALERATGDPARAERLRAQIAEGQQTIKMLFQVLKQITGRCGATGGTDFLSDQP
ncbi:MAG: hypothetical protein VKQ33_12660 [Candidatus Sericytochromatia bacterium]|nr:hypothetical protein [Candidatus Sericytochromatia bacterium]